MFLHVSVILFTGKGGLCQGDPLDRDPPDRDPPDRDPPYGNERAVRTLLECILVADTYTQLGNT